MDKIVINNINKYAIMKKCGTCLFGKDKDLQQTEMQKGWVYCIRWNGQKPFNGLCSEWKS